MNYRTQALDAARVFWQQHTKSDALSMTMTELHADVELVIRAARGSAQAAPSNGALAAPAQPVAWQVNHIADHVADNWPMRKYDLAEIEQRLRGIPAAPQPAAQAGWCKGCNPDNCGGCATPAVSEREFKQFLSDVLTAAGLVTHGKKCKDLGRRLGEMSMRLRTAPKTAAAPVQALAAWNPIETAPKDESNVVLLRQPCGSVANGYFFADVYTGNGAWIWPYTHKNPTHWMPLPAPPA